MMEGLKRLMAGDKSGPINIGNPGEFSIVELAETVKAVSSVIFYFISHERDYSFFVVVNFL